MDLTYLTTDSACPININQVIEDAPAGNRLQKPTPPHQIGYARVSCARLRARVCVYRVGSCDHRVGSCVY